MRTFTILKIVFLSISLFFLFTNTSSAQGSALFEDFENMNQVSIFAGSRPITTPNGAWLIAGSSAYLSGDRLLGEVSIRLRANNSDPATGAVTIPGEGTNGANVIQMQFDKPSGVGEVSFFYGSFSTHGGGVVSVEYSTNAGLTWIKPANNAVTAPKWDDVKEMRKFTVPINVQGNVRVRIIKYKQSGTTNSVNVDNLHITDYVCENCVIAPTFTPPSGSYAEAINVAITSGTAGATIRYTLNGDNPTEESEEYLDPIAISTQTILKARAWKEGMEPSTVSTANYIFPQAINTLAELRAFAPPYNADKENIGTTVYTYTGNAVVTHVQNFNSVKYIQDENTAIMIFDPNKQIQVDVTVGDKISNITGTLTNYFGMIQIVPTGE